MPLLLLTLLQVSSVGRAAVFQAVRVLESSGVAVSRAHPGVLWTHNDSGDGPYLYATDTSGRDLGSVRVPGADAVDWEDLALGPCPRQQGDCLFIGDVGDNFEGRVWVTVYAVPEPDPPRSGGDTLRVTRAPAVLHFRYPDGAHDVETLYVSPLDGTVFLVTKGRSGRIVLYGLAGADWGSDVVVTAKRLQVLPIVPDPRVGNWITGGAMRWDGRLVALRTQEWVQLFTVGAHGRLDVAHVPCRIPSLEYQGEAVDFYDDSTLVLTSESNGPRRPGQIQLMRCAVAP